VAVTVQVMHHEPVPARGMYIALEGADGSGKSTQAALLATALGAVASFEPGASSIGAVVRQALLHGDDPIGARSEVLLFAADRAQHLDDIVEPALIAGRDVVSDRSVWSSVAYQGIGRGVGADVVLQVNRFACRDILPDLVIYLRSDTTTAASRIGTADRIESAGSTFHEAVHAGFEHLAVAHQWVIVEPGSVADVHAAVLAAVEHARHIMIVAQP
jgi:dTMP kinase